MATTIHCDIVSAEESIFSGRVELLVASGIAGDLGVMPGHAPLLTQLQPGPVRIKTDNGEEQIFYVSGGMLEVQPSVVTVLADTAVRADSVDEAAAEEAKKKALEELLEHQGEVDYASAAAQLAESVAQLRTLGQIRKKTGR